MSSTRSEYVPRVNQLDSIHLDKDITRMIRENLLENLQTLSPILFVKIQPEVDLLIQSAIWFGSVGKNYSTFGQQLLVLAYDSEKLTISRLCLHFALTVLPKYLKSNAEYRLSNYDWLRKSIEYGEHVALGLSILNFFRFLKTGKKPSLIDYLLGLDYISLQGNRRREIGYKSLTRELLWGGFTELLGLVLPMINFYKIRRVFNNIIFGSSDSSEIRAIKKPELRHDTCCVYCGDRPTLPHHIGCGHIYCFYCIKANTLADSGYCCNVCGHQCSEGVFPVDYMT